LKLLFVASDFSGLGKGTFCASIARLLRSNGINARIMKSDLYFNYDAGTINPQEHGEVYVLSDGTEVDQDFGMYERFTGIPSTSLDYVTSGRVFHQIYLNEREGKYLGETVSTEHVIDEIKNRFYAFSNQAELGIIELGATIGDIKGIYAMEACREIINEIGDKNALFILLSHIPYLANVNELKTMGCQRSVAALRAKGIYTDIIIARTPSDHANLPDYQLGKIARYCGVSKDYILSLPDLADEYEMPTYLANQSVHQIIAVKLGLILRSQKDFDLSLQVDEHKDLRIALLGKYSHSDAYISIIHQLRMLGVTKVEFVANNNSLDNFDGVVVPGGWGERGIEELIQGVRVCREKNIPTLGICLGLQIMVIEFARNILGMRDANSAEFAENGDENVVVLQEEQKRKIGLGGSARLGDWTTYLEDNSLIASAYGEEKITKRHRHRYEISPVFDFGSFRVTGRDERSGLVEVMELDGHPFFVGVQFHPEFGFQRDGIFKAFVDAAHERQQSLPIPPLSRGTKDTGPMLLPDSVVPASITEINEIAVLSDDQIASRGINKGQRSLFKKLSTVLEEKKREMSQIEERINRLQGQMRDINLRGVRLDGGLLSEKEKERLKELERKVEGERAKIREKRMMYQDEIMRIENEIMTCSS
jgi:CTP synthase